jgi:hypothetical protein
MLPLPASAQVLDKDWKCAQISLAMITMSLPA